MIVGSASSLHALPQPVRIDSGDHRPLRRLRRFPSRRSRRGSALRFLSLTAVSGARPAQSRSSVLRHRRLHALQHRRARLAALVAVGCRAGPSLPPAPARCRSASGAFISRSQTRIDGMPFGDDDEALQRSCRSAASTGCARRWHGRGNSYSPALMPRATRRTASPERGSGRPTRSRPPSSDSDATFGKVRAVRHHQTMSAA